MKHNLTLAVPCLLTLLFGLGVTLPNPSPPESEKLVRYYSSLLDSRYYGDRMDGIAGLGNMGKTASDAVPELIAKSNTEQNNFYRLLGLWSLAEIGTQQALHQSRKHVQSERRQLLEGRFPDVAARTALFVSIDRSDAMMQTLNSSLPSLYNKACDGDLTEKLIASWALYQVGTPVTKQTADRSMTAAARAITPNHGNYTRHLRYIRLAGSPAHRFFAEKLKTILETYDFTVGLTPKRALTAYTLAVIAWPDEDPAVTQFREEIDTRLGSVLDRGSALDDIEALGPFACSQYIIGNLREISNESSDESDTETAEQALSVCR